MKPHLSPPQIECLLELASRAAKGIMDIYQSHYTVTIKSDESPVTQADINAGNLLEQELPNIARYPVLSEENIPQTPEWLDWQTYWLIDPVDGTKQFINKTGDFCICIALIHKNAPVLGLVYKPTTDTAWLAQSGDDEVSKFHNNHRQPMSVSTPTLTTVTLSSNYLSSKMSELLSVFSEFAWHPRGSALKYIDLIEGKAHLYPKMWDTCEWDSAAGQCLLECAGGHVIDFETGEPLRYGAKKSLLNPHFLAYSGISQEEVDELLALYQKITSCE